MRTALPISAGIICGTALFAAVFGVWMVFGADPDKDPLVSW